MNQAIEMKPVAQAAQEVAGVPAVNEDAAAVATIVGRPGGQDRDWVRHESDHSWTILRKNKDGTQTTDGDKGHIPAIPIMPEGEAILCALDLAAKQGTKREAFLSLLCSIFQATLPDLEPWQGKGNPTEGLDRTLSGQFQRCEDKYFQRFMDPQHPQHKLFIGRLPKEDARKKPLHINGKLVPQKQFDAFLTATRSDSTYSTFKSLCLQLFSYTGQLPFADDGTIVPPEVIRLMVEKAKIIVPRDDGFRARLEPFYRTLCADSDEVKKPVDEDLPTIVAMLDKMLEAAKGMENLAAIRATARVKVGDVQRTAEAAIADAKNKLEGTGSPKMDSAQAAAKVNMAT